MSQNEVLELLTKHARGQTEEEVISVISIEKGITKTTKDKKKIVPGDQISALKELSKRYLDVDKFMFDKRYKKKKMDHDIELDKKKLELEEKKLVQEDTEDNTKAIKEFIEATKPSKSVLKEIGILDEV